MKKALTIITFLISLTLLAQEELDYEFQNEMYSKSLSELKLLRNEFFARQGYSFNSKELKQHFSQFNWYKGTKSIDEIELPKKDQAQVNFIKKVEQEKKLNESRIKILKILPEIPTESMETWEWKKEDRTEYINNSIEVGYLINDNSGTLQKRFLSDNHFFVQVVDGVWELFVIPIDTRSCFIMTVDIVGDGHFLNTYKYKSNIISKLNIKDVFPKNLYQYFISEKIDCKDLEEIFPLNFEVKDEKITVSSWYADECLLEKKLEFRFDKENLKYELIK